MFHYCIILAGGFGTRLWPASTSARPKQFLRLPGAAASRGARAQEFSAAEEKSRTFLSAAVERGLAATGKDGRVIIVAGRNHIHAIAQECSSQNAVDRGRLVLLP
ncbi:MAG: sugar phosphate nucleotidyltransferase, partial [Treponema sp.]|nr:sugar phosphate nucleotidyltransferase [Treponema sp.]